jgi:hypothetical protein
MTSKLAAIVTGPDTYLDHLGVISYIMKMPIFITEKTTYNAALTFYPQIQAVFKDASELDADFLSQNFDVLFESGKFFALQLAPILELLYKKRMRFIYCPHGHSDKGHSAKNFVRQDISLIYGDHMYDLLKKTGAINKIGTTVTTGNYRKIFYHRYQTFYDTLTHNLIGTKLNSEKKTALYAPSWQDGENPSSFFSFTDNLIQSLKNDYNLIIKLHPFLEKFHPAETYKVLERHKNDPNVIFLENFPSIYPLLEICDLYLGDYSSIGYDYLAFNKPLYFLIPDNAPSFNLHKGGLRVPLDAEIKSFISNTWEENVNGKSEMRKSIYKEVFGVEKSFDEIQKDILDELKVFNELRRV